MNVFKFVVIVVVICFQISIFASLGTADAEKNPCGTEL